MQKSEKNWLFQAEDHRRGFTLGWVIAVMMAVMLLMMSALAISASHIDSWRRSHRRRQMNMTAISTAHTIALELEESTGQEGLALILERMLSDAPEGEAALLGLPPAMGEVKLRYCYKEGILVLTVRASDQKEMAQTTLSMRRKTSKNEEISWEILGYRAEEWKEEEAQ